MNLSITKTLKGSNDYRNYVYGDDTTPTGSQTYISFLFYKHSILSELLKN